MKNKLVSIVIPCYNEESVIPIFAQEMKKISQKMYNLFNIDFEYIFVDDGSTDETASVIKNLANEHTNINYIILSRNFGKESALFAGLEQSRGDFVTVMDVDLQDPPSMLIEMYKAITLEGYDTAAARRVTRKGEPPVRSFFARIFYKLINKISDIEMVDGARDYRLMKRQVVDSILQLKEYNRYSKGLFSFVGFNTKWLEYENIERSAGETKWSFYKLFKYALDGIIAFSTTPLVISSVLGMLLCVTAFFLLVFIVIRTLVFGDPTSGWPSMICVVIFFSGIQLFSMGILGQYLSKAYLEVKKRPIYISKEVYTHD